jgi:hypothetical protein
MKQTITAVGNPKPFSGKNGTIYYNDYFFADGSSINLGSKEQSPSWGQVGKEIEYEQDGVSNNGKPKYKRVTQNSFGGGFKPRTIPVHTLKRMAKSGAIEAMVKVNSAYAQERLTPKDVVPMVTYIMSGITEDIIAYSEADQDFISRMSALSRAASTASYKSIDNIEALMKITEGFYNYIVKP